MDAHSAGRTDHQHAVAGAQPRLFHAGMERCGDRIGGHRGIDVGHAVGNRHHVALRQRHVLGIAAIAVLAEAGARPEHLVRLTWYVTDKHEYLASLPQIGRAYRAHVGRHFPAMALVQVVALLEDRAKVEIEATAVLPEA